MTPKQKIVASVIGVLTVSLVLGACGRRGPLEAPDASYSGSSSGGSGSSGSSPAYRGGGSGSLEDAVIGYDSKKPQRKFILDGLI
uniref:LPS translocon maturation chaperone LptM n=1 Tax=Pararhizobium sp. IMCC3301 TaxID=3067904 RepID=UPI00274070D9|nr:lipoprotein [Pararhizobium sp. IMCC3301]